jgi:hypothetical protein
MGEFDKKQSSWKTMPATMIRKVAIVSALRDAFPEDFQGMYDSAEMKVDDAKLETKAVDIVEVENEQKIDEAIERANKLSEEVLGA